MSAEKAKPNLIQSIALGGASCVFTVNFTHPIGTKICFLDLFCIKGGVLIHLMIFA